MKTLILFLALIPLSCQAFFWRSVDRSLSDQTIEYWQPATDENFRIPERPYDLYNYNNQISRSGLNRFERIIPTYDKKGTLFASYTQSTHRRKKTATVIIVHGGHGITPGEMVAARWFLKELDANVLILDSFWSRGRFQNHSSTNQFGVDMRVLDVLAARQWLETRPEVDQDLVYVYGGSQGGWTALRLMTDDPFINQHNKKFKAAFSLYPFCRESPKHGGLHETHAGHDLILEPWHAPNLGPYSGRIYVFTGGKDEPTDIRFCNSSIFKQATEWHHYPEGTHSWDLPNRGVDPAVDGECIRAKNPLLRFQQCRNDQITYDVLGKIRQTIMKDILNH